MESFCASVTAVTQWGWTKKLPGQTKSTVYGHEWNNFMNSLSTFSNRLIEKCVQKNFAAEILVIDL